MDTLIKNLVAIVGPDNVLSKPDELIVFECDGLPHHKHRPRAVVFPTTTEQTAAVMKELTHAKVPFTPRGAGTGLSGGALALNDAVVIEMARMRQILKIDPANRLAVVQPGVVNLQVSRAAAPYGLYYVPDPSSQPTCTIGGNIAEGAGGIHCLKYGTTTDHVIGARVVLSTGEIIDLGGPIEREGYDLLGTFIGSEGTFGIATEATLRLLQNPPAVRTLLAEFGEVNDASHAVSAIIAAGVMPAALEMMDHEIIRAVEASVFAAGLPPDAGAALIVELDGIEAGLEDEVERVTDICMEFAARSCRGARDENERKKLWAARKGAFGAIGRISPDSMIQDAVVPRSRLPEVLSSAYDIAARYQLRIANVFHAGDGNLHPLICFDSRDAEEVIRVKEAGRELMEVCVSAGGTITGEHGVGLDKRDLLPLVFSEADMNAMLSIRAAFDPNGICNPGKIIPMLRGCGEGRAVAAEFDNKPVELRSNPVQSSRPTVAGSVEEIVGVSNIDSLGDAQIAYPTTSGEVIELIRFAAHNKLKVTPVGNMTWVPQSFEADLVVSTSRMNRIIEHEPADLIAVAEPGVSLKAFNEALRTNGQWLPLDPPNNGKATLGGIVATGIGEAQQFGYGRPRGSVIGMKVVLADGTLIKAGGRVVKNVAGYDLCKLFTGSYGTLGIITEINFKLRPTPRCEHTLVVVGPLQKLVDTGQRILESRLFPVALELVSSQFARELELEVPEASVALLIRFAGNKSGVEFQVRQSLVELNGVQVETVTNDQELWRRVAALSGNATEQTRVSVLPSKVPALVGQVQKGSQKWQVGIADGRVRIFDLETMDRLKTVVTGLDGRLFLESPNRPDFSGVPLMSRIKNQLDPNGIFI